MGPAVIIQLLDDLAKLGVSPAVQQLVLGWLINHAEITPGALDQVVAHLKDPAPPKED